MYDFLLIGAGLFGSVCARQLTDRGYKCLVIDKRDYVGGNCCTFELEGIDVHKHGAHIFHTKLKEIWDYLNRYTTINNYVNRVKSDYRGVLYCTPPINLFTFYQLWGTKTSEEALEVLENKKVKIAFPKNLEEFILSEVGEEVYLKFIYGYTYKQWGREPKDLPVSIIKRVPIRYTFDDLYFSGQYQGVPNYSELFDNLLNNIDIRLTEDFWLNKNKYIKNCRKIIYTGPIDEYFDYRFGPLEYRSLRFEHTTLDKSDYQGCPVINYTDKDIPYTRVLEHKYFNFKKSDKTVITKEYPSSTGEPYYPINDEKNTSIYNKYKGKRYMDRR